MKRLLPTVFLLIFISSCKKETGLTGVTKGGIEKIQAILEDSLQRSDYAHIDFSKVIQTTVNSNHIFFRLSFKGKSLENEMVLLQTDERGNLTKGRIITIKRSEKSKEAPYIYNGTVVIRSLKGEVLIESPIVRGYITAFHPALFSRQGEFKQALMMAPELPEVVVVGYLPPGGGISYSDWMYLEGLFGGNSGGSSGPSGYYGSANGTGGSNGGGYSNGGSYSGGGSATVYQDLPLLIDFEDGIYNPAIDIQKYLNCFSSISDAGAKCSIEIFTDIPVDGHPEKFFNWQSGSPGHTFLKLKKENGGQTVQQIFGWYPAHSWEAATTTAPLQGKFVDNQHHEFNAYLTMNITPVQLQTAITRVSYLARFIKYDIDEFNCTDFALEVLNAVRSPRDEIQIPRYNIPGGMAVNGTSTPNGLYQTLKMMKTAGGTEAANIEIPGVKGWAGVSHGACN